MKRKKFIAVIVIVVVGFMVLGYKIFKPAPPPVVTEEMKIEREFQRNLVAGWYEIHQKNIEQTDRNFKSFHDILENIREGNLTKEEADERLLILEENARKNLENIRNNIPDTRLSDNYYDLVTAIRDKTIKYAEAAYHTIGKVRLANENNADYETLDNIRVRFIPTGLFVADEVVALRESLEVKEE